MCYTLFDQVGGVCSTVRLVPRTCMPALLKISLPTRAPSCPSSSPPACQDPKCSNLADWYQAFAAVHGQGGADEERGEGGAAGGSKKPKKAAVKKAGGKKAAASKARGKAGSSAAGGKGGDEAANQRELAARFSQATAELQFVGFIRPAKRRRGDYAQRMIHMPAAGS